MPSALSHDPAITVPGVSTDNAIVIFDGTGGTGFGNSTIVVDSGGNGRIGLATDTNLITLTNETVAVAGAITGVTALTVDNININGNTISSTAGTDLFITPLGGQQLILDGLIIIDNGVVTGATSITSTAFVGALTGAVTATQVDITAAGDLRLQDSSGGQYVALEAAGAQGSASTFLQNNGSGALSWAAAGGDLSFGGDAFGADKIIGSTDAYALSFETAGVVRMRIEGAAGSYHAAGVITMPTQPCVLAYNSAQNPNVTGNNAWAIMEADTELFDQNDDFNNATDSFIAPVTGKYLISCAIDVGGLIAGSFNFYWELVETDLTIEMARYNRSSFNNTIDRWKTPGTVVLPMDAGNTVYARINIDGDSGDNADINGDSTRPLSWISVVLVA